MGAASGPETGDVSCFPVDTLFLSKVGTASVLTPSKGPPPDKMTPVPKLNGKEEPAR